MNEWQTDNRPAFFQILPIVTGEGEALFFDSFLRSLMESGKCCFVKPRKIGQLRPRSPSKRLKMIGTGKELTSRQEELGLVARRFLERGDDHLVILVDDLEASEPSSVFELYRIALDKMLGHRGLSSRASVHFLVRMVEAYYFADVSAINDAIGLSIECENSDPELLPHPKGRLKQICKENGKTFNEKTDGFAIVKRLDLPLVLSNPNWCKSLRSLVKWCSRMIGDPDGDRFQLVNGLVCDVTGTQIPELRKL